MFDLAAFSAASFWAFLQVFSRVSALIAVAPVFGSREVPSQVKIGLAAILSLVMLPLVQSTLDTTVPATLYGAIVVILQQASIGLLIGFVASLLFVAVRVGGDVLDYQIGFTQASTFNPQFNETISPIANFQYRYALVLYLVANGHWLLIASLERSFIKLPITQMALTSQSVVSLTNVTYQALLAGVQIAAPGAAILLITDIAFALLNRAVPQMQVYYVGMPVKVMAGFALLTVVLPLLTYVLSNLIQGQPDDIYRLLQGLHRLK